MIPWTVGFALGALYLHYAQFGFLQNILRGISAAAAGMIIATGIKLLMAQRGRPIAWLFAGLAFAGLAVAKLPLLIVVVVLMPLSVAAAYLGSARVG